MDEDNGLYDLEYYFSSEEEEVNEGSGDAHEPEINAWGVDCREEGHGEDGDEIEKEYGALEELQSCSSTNKEIVGLCKPR